MLGVPLEEPTPDFGRLERILKGEEQPQKVPFVEVDCDAEVVKYVIQDMMKKEWIPARDDGPLISELERICFYHRMGYDYVPINPEWKNLPTFKERKARDTACLSRGERSWVEEREGIIKNWDDFERIDWENIQYDSELLRLMSSNLPPGMKLTVTTSLFEMILKNFMGYTDLFFLSHDNPELVEAVFRTWGQKVYQYYKEVVKHPVVGAIFHGDDLGYKTGTMVSPHFLRKNVFPWFRKYASLAHEYQKTFWLHSCGDLDKIMKDLIEDVKIDALHSFEDSCCSAVDYKRKYGDSIAILGGIDIDKLARMKEPELRAYVRQTLDHCMVGGKYALGSGNTVANYIPPGNYLVMLDEGLRWRRA